MPRSAVDINPASALAERARFDADTVALYYAGGDLTYAELADRAARLAGWLAARGIGVGDRVAYVGLNSPTFLIAMFACFRLGAIYVPVNFRLAGPELARVLVESGAVAAICEEGHRAAVEAALPATALVHLVLVDDDSEVPAADPWPAGWLALSDALRGVDGRVDGGLDGGVDGAAAIVPRGFDDIAVLMFTSGTTGQPKGVIITHGNAWWNSVNVELRLDTRRGDVTYASAPLFHIGALNSFTLRTLVRGGSVLVRRTFDPVQFLDDLRTYRINSFFAVAAMLAALARVPGTFDTPLPDLRAVVAAGAPVPPSLIAEYAEHGIMLQQAWGLTETAPFATHLPVERTLDKLGSAGIAMPYTEVRVVDPATGRDVDPGVPGELVVRGPNVTPGYWHNPEATAAAFDSEGWFHSGDVGYLDEDGYLFIVDRLKDMIITGGENVYPAEVENALADLPGIGDVAVIGTADERWGETVVAVLSVSSGCSAPSLEQVRAHAADRLARYKLPHQLRVVPVVPRNASGKLDKLKIKELLAAELFQDGEPS